MFSGWDNNILVSEYFLNIPLYYTDDLTWCVKQVSPPSNWMKFRSYGARFILISTFLVVILTYSSVLNSTKSKHGHSSFTKRFLNISNPNYRYWLILTLVSAAFTTIVWNIILVKAVFRSIVNYPVDTVRDLVDNDYDLMGGTMAKMAVRQNLKVSCPPVLKLDASLNIIELIFQFILKFSIPPK